MARCQLGSFYACIRILGSKGVRARPAIRYSGMGWWVEKTVLGLLVPSWVRVIIGLVLVGPMEHMDMGLVGVECALEGKSINGAVGLVEKIGDREIEVGPCLRLLGIG